ncbi:MAG: helix-turn-helix domain-containing protein [Nitrospirae bacterium]|nr:helix-turn-helix domain-containing protein [Nitrospirota bacterium]
MNQAGSDWISVVEACKILGVARNTLKKLIREGTLPAYTIQGVAGYRLKRQDVEALLQPVVVHTPKKQKRNRKTSRGKSSSR